LGVGAIEIVGDAVGNDVGESVVGALVGEPEVGLLVGDKVGLLVGGTYLDGAGVVGAAVGSSNITCMDKELSFSTILSIVSLVGVPE